METTNEVKCGIGEIYAKKTQQVLRDGIAAIIDKMKESGKTTLYTESKSKDAESIGDTIYAYVLDDEMRSVSEWEVKGLKLTDDGELLVLVDAELVQYTPEDVDEAFGKYSDDINSDMGSQIYTLWWKNEIFYDDMLQADMTAMCILRDIDSFLDE